MNSKSAFDCARQAFLLSVLTLALLAQTAARAEDEEATPIPDESAPIESQLESAPSAPTAPKAGPIRPPDPGKRKTEAVINFDADVIEGKKKAPDLFLQSEAERLAPDAMVFIRRNFNDFHEQDRSRRPQFTP